MNENRTVSFWERWLRDWTRRVGLRSPQLASDEAPRKSILVFRTGQLGDTLVALPAIHALKARHRRDELILLTDKHPGKGYVSSWDILGPTGWFEKVIFYEPERLNWRSPRVAFETIRSIRRTRTEVVYNLMPSRNPWQWFRDQLFFRCVVGAQECHSRGVHRSPPRRPNQRLPRVEPEWRVLFEVIPGAKLAHFDLRSLIHRPDFDRAAGLLKSLVGNNSIQFVALGPGSKMPSKVWPEERYIDLVQRLLARFNNTHFIILGGKEDEAIAKRISSAVGTRVHSFAGNSSVMESAAILATCKAYIGNDTGTMHLAAMVGVPCVALFSARDLPGRWDPYGDNHSILRREVACEGCMLRVCSVEANKCLRQISVDDTFSASARVLSALH